MSWKIAGRELDALIAEKVMGCKPFTGTDGKTLFCNCGRESSFDHGIHEDRHNGIKPYSTDIAAAWTVVEKLRGAGHRFEMRSPPTGYWAYFGEEMSAEAATAPHAISLAALKAVGALADREEG